MLPPGVLERELAINSAEHCLLSSVHNQALLCGRRAATGGTRSAARPHEELNDASQAVVVMSQLTLYLWAWCPTSGA